MRTAFLLLFLFSLTSIQLDGQVMEFDMLEMKYSQGHYRAVYRKAGKLLDNPEYDYSFLPRYYKSIAGLQLAQNDRWYRRNKDIIKFAKENLSTMQNSIDGNRVLEAHIFEMSALKNDLKQWANELKRNNEIEKFNLINDLINSVFNTVPYVHSLTEDKSKSPKTETITTPDEKKETLPPERALLIDNSKNLLGVPYKWAGDSPDGFDCSGFTAYIYDHELKKKLPRRAVDQYQKCTKIKRKHVQPGDLVFFDNGSGISHVGIIVSVENNSLQMIHSSTSIGISIVDIEESEYWRKRIAGFGTYF